MSLLRSVRRRMEDHETPLQRCLVTARSFPDELLESALRAPPEHIKRSPRCMRYWPAVVNDEIVSREALSNARRKLALKEAQS